jgi:2-polyprenyl-3-methyl-5-hydroxy-6-metoxy-1,4-benzoquinol methylase
MAGSWADGRKLRQPRTYLRHDSSRYRECHRVSILWGCGDRQAPSPQSDREAATTYFDHVRSDIRPLLPPSARRILDVGCGAGNTLAWLQTLYPAAHTIGLEYNEELRPQLAANAHEHYVLDIDKGIPPLEPVDLLLCLDVLEHLPDPGAVLAKLAKLLSPGGVVIVSLPNIAHFSVSLPLMLEGKFSYTDAGILDRTHLRFFVKNSAISLLNDAGLSVNGALLSGFGGRKTKIINTLTLNTLKFRLSRQLILQGTRHDAAFRQDPVSWRVQY